MNALIPNKSLSFRWYPTAVLSVIICFGMFTAGFEKLLRWVDFDLSTSGFLSWFYSGYFSLGQTFILADLVFIFPPLINEILDYSAVVFELSPFFFLLAGACFWKAWLLVACIFHFTNTCLLNITFDTHLVVYCSFFLYPLLQEKRYSKFCLQKKFLSPVCILSTLFGIYHLSQRLIGKCTSYLFIPHYSADRQSVLYVSLFLWISMFVLGFLSLLYQIRKSNQTVWIRH
jgi:hypothetical protein